MVEYGEKSTSIEERPMKMKKFIFVIFFAFVLLFWSNAWGINATEVGFIFSRRPVNEYGLSDVFQIRPWDVGGISLVSRLYSNYLTYGLTARKQFCPEMACGIMRDRDP